jgi:hypothetical protein
VSCKGKVRTHPFCPNQAESGCPNHYSHQGDDQQNNDEKYTSLLAISTARGGGGLLLPIIVLHQHFRRPTSFLQFLDVMMDMHEEYVSMRQNSTESELNVSPKFTSLGLLGCCG